MKKRPIFQRRTSTTMRTHIIYTNAHIHISILINMRRYTLTHTQTHSHTRIYTHTFARERTLIYLFNIMQARISKTVRFESRFYIFLEFQWGRLHAHTATNAGSHTQTQTHTHTHILFRTNPLYIHVDLTYFWTTVPAEHNAKTFYLTS